MRSVMWIKSKESDDSAVSPITAASSEFLQLIDQRLLPGKFVLQKIYSLADTAKAIKTMVRIA